MKDKKYIPSYTEVFDDKPTTTEIENNWLMLLNSDPKKGWLKEHPEYPGHFYLPIDKIEIMLTRIFGWYDIEVLREGLTAGHGVYVAIRLHYVDPVTEKERFKDGVAGWPCHTKGDVKSAFQIAKTNAIKDACDHLGKIFGRDLNRNTIELKVIPLGGIEELESWFEKTKENLDEEETKNIKRIIDNKEKTGYKRAIEFLKTK